MTLTACSGNHATSATTPTPSPTVTTAAPAQQGPIPGPAVPHGAFVSPADLGPGWTVTAALPPPCAPVFARAASSSVGLEEQRGVLTETIATRVDVERTVAGWRTSLAGCGFQVGDEQLGDAGLLATKGGDAVVVTGTEGVLIVLHAHGGLAASRDDLDAWSDLALGTSCVAAPDGCH